MWETWVRSLGWEDPLVRERLPTPVFWPGEFHGYSPWGRLESDTTGRRTLSLLFLTRLCTCALSLPLAICCWRSSRTQTLLQQPQEDTALQNHSKSINRPPSNVEGTATPAPTPPHSWSTDDLKSHAAAGKAATHSLLGPAKVQ